MAGYNRSGGALVSSCSKLKTASKQEYGDKESIDLIWIRYWSVLSSSL
jgi:hypothetical protein